uniref:Uncharacterized protein n=1 Tax=Arundo donax TaxID=35708 RepID=A0A0A9E8L1_ARUDO
MSSPPVASFLTWPVTLSDGATVSSSSTHISARTFHRTATSCILPRIWSSNVTPSARMASSYALSTSPGWKRDNLSNISTLERQPLRHSCILRCRASMSSRSS